MQFDREAGPVIWARGRTSLRQCPTSYVTAESTTLLEEFYAWKLFGTSDCYGLPARVVEAIVLLENELRAEQRDAEK